MLESGLGLGYTPKLGNNIVYPNLPLRDSFAPSNIRNNVSYSTQLYWLARLIQMLHGSPPWVVLPHEWLSPVISSMGLLHGLLLRHSHISRSPNTLMGPLGIWFTVFLNLFLWEACFREIPAQQKHREECHGKPSLPFPGTPEYRELALAENKSTFMLPRGSSNRAGMFPQDGQATEGLWNPVGFGIPFPQRGGWLPWTGVPLSTVSDTFLVFKVLADRVQPPESCLLSSRFVPQPQASVSRPGLGCRPCAFQFSHLLSLALNWYHFFTSSHQV